MTRRLLSLTLAIGLLAAACGGDPETSGSSTTAQRTTSSSATTSAGSGTTDTGAPTSAGSTTTTLPAPTTTVAGPDPSPDAEPGVIVAVLDGDSMEIETAFGVEEVRLEGINTPERDECWGDEARSASIDLTQGSDVLLAGSERDQYGRLIGFVWVDGELLNLRLIERGAAIAIVFDHAYLDEFLDAEESAFSAGAGLWALDACGPRSDARIAIRTVEFDPPGRDYENPNEEIVVLVNDGDAFAMAGWVLRDESTAHRYSFPSDFVLGAGDAVAIHTGCGDDGGDHLYWCASDAVWSNGGDTALLLDPNGNVVDRYRFSGYLG